jgi:hypothetical protein
MTVSLFIALFAVNLVFVLCKSFQQKSVMHDKKLWILPVSMVMSSCETFMIGSIAVLVVASQSYWSFIPSGLGAGVGCILGLEIFNRINKEQ